MHMAYLSFYLTFYFTRVLKSFCNMKINFIPCLYLCKPNGFVITWYAGVLNIGRRLVGKTLLTLSQLIYPLTLLFKLRLRRLDSWFRYVPRGLWKYFADNIFLKMLSVRELKLSPWYLETGSIKALSFVLYLLLTMETYWSRLRLHHFLSFIFKYLSSLQFPCYYLVTEESFFWLISSRKLQLLIFWKDIILI